MKQQQSSTKEQLIQSNALGNDRNLANNNNDFSYWYSVGDGCRLLLNMRKELLNYSESKTVKEGEEYVAFRENINGIFLADPYYQDNFENYLADDINRILAQGEQFEKVAFFIRTQGPSRLFWMIEF